MSAPAPNQTPPDPTPGKRIVLTWKSAAAAMLSWVVVDMGLHFLIGDITEIGGQIYLGLGFYVMLVRKIQLPVRFDAFDLQGWFRAFYWAAWWPWYLVRRQR